MGVLQYMGSEHIIACLQSLCAWMSPFTQIQASKRSMEVVQNMLAFAHKHFVITGAEADITDCCLVYSCMY